jgi:hypothetical protein
MAILKDELLKDNLIHFVSDLPAYAYIAFVNISQVYLPQDYPEWERFLLKHGWLFLLGVRFVIAIWDLTVRIIDREEYVDSYGRIRKKSLWQVTKQFFKEWVK